MTGLSKARIMDRLPYLGLDIEGEGAESVRIEYNPNRPDFSSDYGIARALRGLVGRETGVKKYRVAKGKTKVFADRSLAKVRPFIACVIARRIKLDEETIRQLISMQEDLHNGLGRKRRKVAIGLHDLKAIVPPIHYTGKYAEFAFTPLGSAEPMTIRDILDKTDTGKAYGHILAGKIASKTVYPILQDSVGTVLSFPPIINGDRTKVGTKTRSLFVDVTSTDERLGNEVLAIISCALADAKGKLETVTVNYSKSQVRTPQLAPSKMKYDHELATAMTGLRLSKKDAKACLKRSRLDIDGKSFAVIPAYRVDILHPVDLAEEVAIGYGLDRIEPSYPPSSELGRFDQGVAFLESLSTTMTEEGFNETMNYDLTDEPTLYGKFERDPGSKIEVDNPRSMEHYLLRDSLLPSLLAVLGRNVKSQYPQKLFEAGKVFLRGESGVEERFRLAVVAAYSESSYTEAKMHLQALVKKHFGELADTAPSTHWAFAEGRCAEVVLKGKGLGHLGEVRPKALANFGIDMPAWAFEIEVPSVKKKSA